MSLARDLHLRVNDEGEGRLQPSWREHFRTRSELDQSPLTFAVDRIIPHDGVTGIGGLSGNGKSWVMLSMAKAILAGEKLWDVFKTTKHPVLYLSPETGDRSLNYRLEKLDIPNSERFLIRTMSQGQTLSLENEAVVKAAKRRVVFLDTLPRFTAGLDEQAAKDMRLLNEVIFALLQNGAVAVVFAHHSPKNSRNEPQMDLENSFRGSGDIGASMSAAHAVRMIDEQRVLLHVENVKARDFRPLRPFQLQGRPYISNEGDLRLVKKPGDCEGMSAEKKVAAGDRKARSEKELEAKIANVIKKTSGLSGSAIYERVKGNRNAVFAILKKGVEEKRWSVEEKCYFISD